MKIGSFIIIVELIINLGSNANNAAPNNPKCFPKNLDEIK